MNQDHIRHRIHPGWGSTPPESGYFADRGRVEQQEKESPAGGKKGRFDRQAALLLAVSGLFGIANALSGTFVGIYLWKAKNDFALIGWFTLAIHLTMAVTFWLAGKWVKEHNKMNCLRLGVAVSACFYTFILLLGNSSINYIIWLGVIQGISHGLFWIAFNVVYFEVTDPESRDRFNGLAGLLGSGAGIIAPWISGFLIVRLGDVNGYRLIFSISLGIFLLGVVVSFFLKKRKVEGVYEWFLAYRCLKQSGTPWRRVCLALVAQGLREGVFGFMISLLVYISTSSEASLGNFVLITSAVSLLSFWAAGKFIKPRYRKWTMLIGAFVIVAVIVPFFWQLSYTTLLIFGLGTALFLPFYSIPMVSTVFDLIGADACTARQREEYIVLRELGLNTGRVLGVLMFIVVVSWSTAPLVINVFMLLIGTASLVSWAFMSKQLAPAKP